MELSSQDLTLKQKIYTLGKEIRDFQFSVLQNNPQAIIVDNEILNVKLPYDDWADYFDKFKKISEILREIK